MPWQTEKRDYFQTRKKREQTSSWFNIVLTIFLQFLHLMEPWILLVFILPECCESVFSKTPALLTRTMFKCIERFFFFRTLFFRSIQINNFIFLLTDTLRSYKPNAKFLWMSFTVCPLFALGPVLRFRLHNSDSHARTTAHQLLTAAASAICSFFDVSAAQNNSNTKTASVVMIGKYSRYFSYISNMCHSPRRKPEENIFGWSNVHFEFWVCGNKIKNFRLIFIRT